jgi:hypothetical protein
MDQVALRQVVAVDLPRQLAFYEVLLQVSAFGLLMQWPRFFFEAIHNGGAGHVRCTFRVLL